MVALLKGLTVVVMAVLPGGLLVLCLFVFAKVIAERMHHEHGPATLRLARAVTSVRLNDVVHQARRLL